MGFSRKNIPVWRWSVGIVLAIMAVSSWIFVSYIATLFGAGYLLFFFLYLQIGFSAIFLIAFAFRRPGLRSINTIVAMPAILLISILSVVDFSYVGRIGRDYWYLSSEDAIFLLSVTMVAIGALWGLIPWRSQAAPSDQKSQNIIAPNFDSSGGDFRRSHLVGFVISKA
jgi:hypothetical protein